MAEPQQQRASATRQMTIRAVVCCASGDAASCERMWQGVRGEALLQDNATWALSEQLRQTPGTGNNNNKLTIAAATDMVDLASEATLYLTMSKARVPPRPTASMARRDMTRHARASLTIHQPQQSKQGKVCTSNTQRKGDMTCTDMHEITVAHATATGSPTMQPSSGPAGERANTGER